MNDGVGILLTVIAQQHCECVGVFELKSKYLVGLSYCTGCRAQHEGDRQAEWQAGCWPAEMLNTLVLGWHVTPVSACAFGCRSGEAHVVP